MRALFRVRTVSGGLALVAALAPAMAQTGSAPQESGTRATPAIGLNGSLLPSAGAAEHPQESNAAPEVSTGKDSDAAKDSNAAPEASTGKASGAAQDSNIAAEVSPGKDPDAAQDSNTPEDPNAPQFDHGAGSAGPEPGVAIPRADMKKALSMLRRSTRDYQLCTRLKTCSVYFDSYGVAFTFADGTIAAYSHEQRGQISGHDCVVNARNALGRGDRSMAVQWMMAAQNDILNRNWISEHPDAMVEALRTFRGWA